MSPQRRAPKKKKRQKRLGGKKTAVKKKLTAKKNLLRKKRSSKKKKSVRGRSEIVESVVFEPKGLGARSGGQSGDVQGLSGIERAGSESVEELVEEGNAFEAEVVKGVEDASYADEEEVTTHEVPEDDVPEEYRDEK
jgi:hypothetical protein